MRAKNLQRNFSLLAANFIFNAVFFVSCVAYPFFYKHKEMLVLMAILWAFRTILRREILGFFMSAFFVLLCFLESENLRFFYPSLMSFIFGILFLNSLKTEPFITRLAKLKESNLNEKALKYTRNLSAFWALFLLTNGVFALILLKFSEFWWQMWCGVGFYVAFGAIFAVEFGFRKILIKKAENE